jgi:hypothetical protein
MSYFFLAINVQRVDLTTKTETINIGGKTFSARTKRIYQRDLTSDCWMVQVWGIDYCSGFGESEKQCEYLGTVECGGEPIRKLILASKYPKDGLPDVSKGR